ncbi:CU044_2847 family protein [Nonomuraea sp. NPDC001684]
MRYFLEVPLDDGGTVLVEVNERPGDEPLPAGRTRAAVERMPEALGAGLQRVQTFATDVLRRMRSCPEPPDVVAVEFGMKLTAKAGVVVAESTGEAHLKVTVEWRKPEGG